MSGKESLLTADDEGNNRRGAVVPEVSRRIVENVAKELKRTCSSLCLQWLKTRPSLADDDEAHGGAL